MKIIYFLPPKLPNYVWVSFENGDGTFLNDDKTPITTQELEMVKVKQEEIYRSMYPQFYKK